MLGYMKQHFGAKGHAYLHQHACMIDSLGLEKQQHCVLAAAAEKKTELNQI